MYSRAAIRFLRHTPPDLEEVQSNLNAIDNDSHRAVEVFENIRALFGRANSGQETVNVNQIAGEVLGALRGELEEHGITTRTELTTELPLIMGHRGQLQEVILNLIRNAVEANGRYQRGKPRVTSKNSAS